MDDQFLTFITCRLDKIDFMLSLQNKLLEELLEITRSTQLSSAFSVDAINGIYGVLGKISESSKKLRED
jgi:predicted house-cleaning noncanonical NTP pyrophosphatase (MazG superfamily)